MIIRITSPQFRFEGGRAFVIGANSLAILANGAMEVTLDLAGRAQLLLEPGVHRIGLPSMSARPVCGQSRHVHQQIEVPGEPSDDPIVVRLQDSE